MGMDMSLRPQLAALAASAASVLVAALGFGEVASWAAWVVAVAVVVSAVLAQRDAPGAQFATLLCVPLSWILVFLAVSHLHNTPQFAFFRTSNSDLNCSLLSLNNALLSSTAYSTTSTSLPNLTLASTEAEDNVLVTLDGWLDPFLLATPNRYDILHKLVPALNELRGWRSEFGWDLYLEHERRWNGFKEQNKSSALDFRMDFVALISSVRDAGFREDSAVPVCYMLDKDPSVIFPWNGAHRTTLGLALNKKVRVKPRDGEIACARNWLITSAHFNSDPEGSNQVYTDYALYRWIWHSKDRKSIRLITMWPFALQQQRDDLKDPVGQFLPSHNFLSLWLNKTIMLSPMGILNYVQHAYGNVSCVHAKWLNVLGDIRHNSTALYPLALYWVEEDVRSENDNPAKKFRDRIREYYFPITNGTNGTRSELFKHTIHSTDSFGDTLLLSQLALFPHSINYLNKATNRSACMIRSSQLGRALGRTEVLPGILLNEKEEDLFLVDSGSVLDVFSLRPGSHFDLAYDAYRSPNIELLISTHAFVGALGIVIIIEENEILDDHGSYSEWYKFHGVKAVELLANPKYYFFCFGVRYVSIPQLIDYKQARNEDPKDIDDVKLLNSLNISSTIS